MNAPEVVDGETREEILGAMVRDFSQIGGWQPKSEVKRRIEEFSRMPTPEPAGEPLAEVALPGVAKGMIKWMHRRCWPVRAARTQKLLEESPMPNQYTSRLPIIPRYEVRDMGYKTPCWTWMNLLSADGYAFAHFRGKTWPAHRAFYTQFKGEIPKGLVIDHLCRVRHCVNPDHLEPVTNSENLKRGARDRPRIMCRRGHLSTPENTRITTLGYKECQDCRAVYAQKKLAKSLSSAQAEIVSERIAFTEALRALAAQKDAEIVALKAAK